MNLKHIHSVLEELYEKAKYSEIICFWEKHRDELDFLNKEGSSDIAEILTVSYFEQGEYKKALYYVNSYLNFLLAKERLDKISDPNFQDDITTFYDLKIEIYHRMNKLVREYVYTNRYLLYGNDKYVTESKEKLEEIFYGKYFLWTKILMFTAIVLLSLFVKQIGFFSNHIFFIISLIIGLWVILNYVFKSKFKSLFLNTFRFLVLSVFKKCFFY